jgi:hypothetical protein
MSNMKLLRQTGERGELHLAVLALIFVSLLFVATAVFGVWAYSERQDYKDNVDAKIAEAVAVAKQETLAADQKKFDEAAKLPYKVFNGPDTYGAVSFEHPKTWSTYLDTSDSSNPVKAYVHPNVVPTVDDRANSFALRAEVVEDSYNSVAKRFDSLVKQGKVKVQPYKLAKLPDVAGLRVDGEIVTEKQGSMVFFPVRDKTLQVWTESKDFVKDYDAILQTLTFSP